MWYVQNELTTRHTHLAFFSCSCSPLLLLKSTRYLRVFEKCAPSFLINSNRCLWVFLLLFSPQFIVFASDPINVPKTRKGDKKKLQLYVWETGGYPVDHLLSF